LNKIFAGLTDPKADNSGHSVLGNAMISRFNIILDYQNKQLLMEKNRYYSAQFILNRSGLSSLTHAEGAAVIAVREDSPVDHHGIEKGDIIISINNIDINEENLDSLLDQINDLNTSKKLCVLKLKTTRCFTLKMRHFKQGTLKQ
jgi:C-terminal processing protease CtpA/Prc